MSDVRQGAAIKEVSMYGLWLQLEEGSPPVLHVRGELDLANAEDFGTALDQALAADATLVVDMAEVTFVDAAGLRVILRAARSRNGAGPLTLANASRVEWLLKVVGLEEPSLVNIDDGS